MVKKKIEFHFRHCRRCGENFKSYLRAKVCPHCYHGHLFEKMYGTLNKQTCLMCHKDFAVTEENKKNCVCENCFEDVKNGERSLKELIDVLSGKEPKRKNPTVKKENKKLNEIIDAVKRERERKCET